jgi:Glycosyltransferase family 87
MEAETRSLYCGWSARLKPYLRIVAGFCLFAITVVLVAAIGSEISEDGVQDRDFLAYWAAGTQLVHHANPYDIPKVLALEHQVGLVGAKPNMLLNLPLAFFLVLPLGLVSAKTGFILWLLPLVASLVLSIRMIRIQFGEPDHRLHLLGYAFPPVVASLMAGQLGTIMLLGVAAFLCFHRSRPFLAGLALILCLVKPHLFLPIGLVLVLWAFRQRAGRFVAGTLSGILFCCLIAWWFDPLAWSQYAEMMHRTAEVRQDFVPNVSQTLRLWLAPGNVSLQFVPVILGSLWGLHFYWRNREHWDWTQHGLVLLCVSELCTPHSWFTDETILVPAIIAAAYRSTVSGRSLLPFAAIALVALAEVLSQVPLTSPYYVWTAPVWLLWYLYATRKTSPDEAEGNAIAVTD